MPRYNAIPPLSQREFCKHGHKVTPEIVGTTRRGAEFCKTCKNKSRKRGSYPPGQSPRTLNRAKGLCDKGLHVKVVRRGSCMECHKDSTRLYLATIGDRHVIGANYRCKVYFKCGEVGYYPQPPTKSGEQLFCQNHAEWTEVDKWEKELRPVERSGTWEGTSASGRGVGPSGVVRRGSLPKLKIKSVKTLARKKDSYKERP